MNQTAVVELSANEIDAVGGALSAADYAGIGLGMVGLGVGIVAAPVGAFGLVVAGGLSYFGGAMIGTAMRLEFFR